MADNDTDDFTQSKDILDSVGKEMKANPPAQLAKTRAKFGPLRAKKQRIAILLSKGRKAGAKVPQRKSA